MNATRIAAVLLALYIASLIVALAYPLSPVEKYVNSQLKQLEREAGSTPNPLQLFLQIYIHNLIASFLSLIAGIVILPMLALIFINGYVVGYVVRDIISKYGMAKGAPLAVSLLLPHGILEIPSFILAAYAGLLPAKALLDKARGRKASITDAYRRGLGIYKKVAVLLLVAAVTEVLITPLIGLATAWMLNLNLHSL